MTLAREPKQFLGFIFVAVSLESAIWSLESGIWILESGV